MSDAINYGVDAARAMERSRARVATALARVHKALDDKGVYEGAMADMFGSLDAIIGAPRSFKSHATETMVVGGRVARHLAHQGMLSASTATAAAARHVYDKGSQYAVSLKAKVKTHGANALSSVRRAGSSTMGYLRRKAHETHKVMMNFAKATATQVAKAHAAATQVGTRAVQRVAEKTRRLTVTHAGAHAGTEMIPHVKHVAHHADDGTLMASPQSVRDAHARTHSKGMLSRLWDEKAREYHQERQEYHESKVKDRKEHRAGEAAKETQRERLEKTHAVHGHSTRAIEAAAASGAADPVETTTTELVSHHRPAGRRNRRGGRRHRRGNHARGSHAHSHHNFEEVDASVDVSGFEDGLEYDDLDGEYDEYDDLEPGDEIAAPGAHHVAHHVAQKVAVSGMLLHTTHSPQGLWTHLMVHRADLSPLRHHPDGTSIGLLTGFYNASDRVFVFHEHEHPRDAAHVAHLHAAPVHVAHQLHNILHCYGQHAPDDARMMLSYAIVNKVVDEYKNPGEDETMA